MADKQLSAEDLQAAAFMRFAEGLSWERIATRLGCARETLRRWRNRGDAWEQAVAEVIAEMMLQGGATAWGCLVRRAHQGDVQAARAILDRVAGAVEQTVHLRRDELSDLSDLQLETLIEDLKAAEAGQREADRCEHGS